MTDRDAPVVLVEDHGHPLIAVEPPRIDSRHEIATGAIIALGFLLGFAFGYTVASAAPRSASAPSIPVAAQARTGALPVVRPIRQASSLLTAPQSAGRAVGKAGGGLVGRESFAPAPALSGIASWYPAVGYVAAAGPGLRTGHWRGSSVIVSANGRSVTVVLTDWCACPGGRLIDLSDDAFAHLAPLSRGLVRVSIQPTLPETDR